jgi:hypothetical protein
VARQETHRVETWELGCGFGKEYLCLPLPAPRPNAVAGTAFLVPPRRPERDATDSSHVHKKNEEYGTNEGGRTGYVGPCRSGPHPPVCRQDGWRGRRGSCRRNKKTGKGILC